LIIHYLSASRLKKYLQCTEAYHQAYENKVRGDAVHLRFGTMIHKVFERWFQEETDILEIYEEEWRQSDVIDPQYYKDGIDMVRNFAETTDKDEITAIGFEQAFAINIEDDIVLDTSGVDFDDRDQAKEFLKKLEEDDKPYIFGFIDRIDYDMDTDTLYIVDYKTSRIALTSYEAQDDEQLSMYALVAQYMFPEYDNVVLELHYVRLGEKVRTRRNEEELARFKRWLIHMYHQIKGDVSPKATLNKYCNWCDARHGCSAFQELINTDLRTEKVDGEQVPLSEEDTEKFENEFPTVEELAFDDLDKQLEKINTYKKILEDRKKEIEKRFKQELKDSDNTPIDVGGAERYVTNNARVNYDVSTVIACFPDKFDDLLSVKKGEVDKLAKGDERIRQMLDETSERYFISPTIRRKKKR
jgi:CRISPR/Cas system-associated exonuclease Cas4 (RecB family)